MKILLSAYACEPNKGSEPGVGWSWAVELAKHHKVWVITRDNNEPTITEYLKENPEYKTGNLSFVYIGFSNSLTFWKKGRRGIRLFYMMWQRKAVAIAKKLHNEIHFDLIQHITFVSYTQPTYMYKLGIPMIWGPISGGENIPKGIKIDMTVIERFSEFLRLLSQYVALISPSVRKTIQHSRVILAATEETKNRIPSKYHYKTMVIPAIGVDRIFEVKRSVRDEDKIKIIMAGRLIYWKAFDIGIKAFLLIADNYPNVELHILGEGKEKCKLIKLSGDKLGKQIYFEPPVKHDKIYEFYNEYDLFVNTTLRDSGCMTMMEAMCAGVPSIGIATGGPNELLKSFDDWKVGAVSYEQCIEDIADKIKEIVTDHEKRYAIAWQQHSYAKHTFTIEAKLNQLRGLYR